MSGILRVTPITNEYRETRYANLPEGWARVWSGPFMLGDMYLSWQRFWNDGVTEWIRLSFDKIVQGHKYEDSAAWFGCLIRERAEDKGEPCYYCGVRAPLEDMDVCDNCCGMLYTDPEEREHGTAQD